MINIFSASHFFEKEGIEKDIYFIEKDGKIIEKTKEIPETFKGKKITELRGLITPPFVNSHTHLELTDKESLVSESLYKKELWDWIIEIVKKKRSLKEEDFVQNIKRGERFLIENTTPFVGDIRSIMPEGPLFYDDRLNGIIFFEVLGYEEDIFKRKWADFLTFLEKHKNLPNNIGLSIHSLYTTPLTKAKELIKYARNNRFKIAIHIAEKREESSFLFNKDLSGFKKIFKEALYEDYNFSSYSEIIDFLDMGSDTILVHCTQFREKDWEEVKKREIPVVICPRSNLYFTGILPDIKSMIEYDVRWAIGTDSLYTNKNLDVFEDARLIVNTFSSIKDIEKKVLYALTYGGLEILGIENNDKIFSYVYLPYEDDKDLKSIFYLDKNHSYLGKERDQ